MVRISATSNITDYEREKLKKEEDFLLIGKEDKTVNVISQGEMVPIKELVTSNRVSSDKGYLEIPTSEGRVHYDQYGLESLPPDSSLDFSFPFEFPNYCFNLQVTQRGGDADKVMGRWIDNSTFRIEVFGGTTNQTVFWRALGF